MLRSECRLRAVCAATAHVTRVVVVLKSIERSGQGMYMCWNRDACLGLVGVVSGPAMMLAKVLRFTEAIVELVIGPLTFKPPFSSISYQCLRGMTSTIGNEIIRS